MRLTYHAKQQAARKGVTEQAILDAATAPTVTYPSLKYPGQMRHVRGEICAIVSGDSVVTFYQNVVETPLRRDQTDQDALAHARRVKQVA